MSSPTIADQSICDLPNMHLPHVLFAPRKHILYNTPFSVQEHGRGLFPLPGMNIHTHSHVAGVGMLSWPPRMHPAVRKNNYRFTPIIRKLGTFNNKCLTYKYTYAHTQATTIRNASAINFRTRMLTPSIRQRTCTADYVRTHH